MLKSQICMTFSAVTLAWNGPQIFKRQRLICFGIGLFTWDSATNGGFILGDAVRGRVIESCNFARYAHFSTCTGKHGRMTNRGV